MLPRLILASDSAGKLRELRALLTPFEVVPQSDFGITSAEEPYETFVENALAKARYAARASGLPALADDSGLCCEALNGAPGVRSARFAAPNATDAQNNVELTRQLTGASTRIAHYLCVLVALRDANDPEPLIAVARWHGRIVDAPRGAGGFGYDPHFYLDEFSCTAAELTAEHKNTISHRGQALRELRAQLKAVWQW